MKKAYKFVITICLALIVCSSCMKDKEYSVAADCVITSFGVGNITTFMVVEDEEGKDVVVHRTIYAGEIRFNIDQLPDEDGLCHIENKDSVANWVSLEKVQPNFTAYGNVFMKIGDDSFVGITSSGDSLNFTNGITLRVASTDGAYFKDYLVKINKYSTPTDTVTWTHLAETNLQLDVESHRALSCLGTEGMEEVERAYIFSLSPAGIPQVTSSVDGIDWEAQRELDAAIDINSVTTHDGMLYAIATDGTLYTSCNDCKGVNWTKVADTELELLLGSDGIYFYGFDGNAIVGTTDFEVWKPYGFEDLDKLPTSGTRIFSHESLTNSKMCNVALIGQCDADTAHSVSWYKVSSLMSEYNQEWAYMEVTAENKYALPKFQDLSIAEFQGALYAIGRTLDEDGEYVMSGFYESFDNGLAWHKKSYKWVLPDDLDADDGAVSLININGTMWAVQNGGNVWKANIR